MEESRGRRDPLEKWTESGVVWCGVGVGMGVSVRGCGWGVGATGAGADLESPLQFHGDSWYFDDQGHPAGQNGMLGHVWGLFSFPPLTCAFRFPLPIGTKRGLEHPLALTGCVTMLSNVQLGGPP